MSTRAGSELSTLVRQTQELAASRRPVAIGLLTGLIALLVWALVVFGKYGGNPTGLARIGDQLPLSPRLQGADLVILKGKRGNDGQQFLSLALDPLQQLPGTSAALDNPIYRGKRLLFPLLAWLAGLGQPALIPWSLGLINVALIGCCGALVAAWAQLEQRSPQWGLAVLALPSYWVTLSLDTADLLATTLLLASAVAGKRALRLAVQASRGRGTRARGSSQRQRRSLRLVRPEEAQASRPVSRLSRATDRLATKAAGRWLR